MLQTMEKEEGPFNKTKKKKKKKRQK